ncbi:polycomb protein Suz12 [Planococcus citri]|uniref:polycomb protein Suz12 n=1 Tax=Planococcus citri TaxID=170843 RepID=UPI0031F90BC1
MRPRKRDKDTDTKKQDHKPDHDLFIQAYEKPTQIYKFLRARFKYSPYFQYRNLTYMSRKSKRKSSRSYFKVDSLLPRIEAQTRLASLVNPTFEYLTIKYLGFFNKEGNTESVKVETLLLKICHKKRKESNCPVMTKSYGTVVAPCNPAVNDTSHKKSRVIIPTESFSLSNGHFVKSYHLLLRVGTLPPSNCHASNKSDTDAGGPAAKKRKISNGVDEKVYEFQYGTNLTVYDKRNRCLLPDGDYQLLMHELTQNSPKLSHVNTSWETIPNRKDHEMSPAFENFAAGPKLKLHLCWTNNPDVEESSVVSTVENDEICSLANGNNKENDNPDNNGVLKISTQFKEENNVNFQIIYQFLYSNNSRQQTEPHKDFCCPWCPKLDCLNLYALLKHLKLCHARFTFAYTEITNGARIDVALNEKYDGSYIGVSREIAHAGVGFGIHKRGPVRRAPVSKILVCHPKRPRRFSLTEFVNEKDENDVDGQRAYISGHNRLYHHTTTCLPIYPKEMDIDSEDESDPKWLQKKTTMMIDDFTDVNDGEKELMKMWNLHVMKYGFVGDCQIPLACTMFLETRGQELLKKNLYRNFVLHLCNMFDFGLISPVTVYTTVQRLQELIGEGTEISTILRESWSLQRKNWLKSEHTAKKTSSDDVKPSASVLNVKCATSGR